eukprot:TRINITY_DN8948_c0_g1_i1.p1 TRINITY_DN8948_c0_g1~~TRINITY_DN8948_c0_g1_i1.p1  ORF type:complete len:588 (-),score=91.50 TRINITY_DN8948_c0_g1_i1:1120-2883(-)
MSFTMSAVHVLVQNLATKQFGRLNQMMFDAIEQQARSSGKVAVIDEFLSSGGPAALLAAHEQASWHGKDWIYGLLIVMDNIEAISKRNWLSTHFAKLITQCFADFNDMSRPSFISSRGNKTAAYYQPLAVLELWALSPHFELSSTCFTDFTSGYHKRLANSEPDEKLFIMQTFCKDAQLLLRITDVSSPNWHHLSPAIWLEHMWRQIMNCPCLSCAGIHSAVGSFGAWDRPCWRALHRAGTTPLILQAVETLATHISSHGFRDAVVPTSVIAVTDLRYCIPMNTVDNLCSLLLVAWVDEATREDVTRYCYDAAVRLAAELVAIVAAEHGDNFHTGVYTTAVIQTARLVMLVTFAATLTTLADFMTNERCYALYDLLMSAQSCASVKVWDAFTFTETFLQGALAVRVNCPDLSALLLKEANRLKAEQRKTEGVYAIELSTHLIVAIKVLRGYPDCREILAAATLLVPRPSECTVMRHYANAVPLRMQIAWDPRHAGTVQGFKDNQARDSNDSSHPDRTVACKMKSSRSVQRVQMTCAVCSKIGNMMMCARCKTVGYCSKDCQRNDWGLHKLSCLAHEFVNSRSQHLHH